MHICFRKCSINAKFYAKEIAEDNVLVAIQIYMQYNNNSIFQI